MPGPPSSVASEHQEAARDEEEERLHFQKVARINCSRISVTLYLFLECVISV